MSDDFFGQLQLDPRVLQGIRDCGYARPMPIQEKTLPITAPGGSVIGQAQTGSGKTAAFLVATFHRLLVTPRPSENAEHNPRALILAPTRELVQQISDNARGLGAHTGLRVHTVLGGMDYQKQRQAFADGVDVLVGTPGRLIDYYKQRVYDLNHLEIVVIDECDRMFDLGFIDDVRWMVRRMPSMQQRQNLLFSATVDHRVQELAWELMNDPPLVEVDATNTPPDRIKQTVYHLSRSEKPGLLIGKIRKWAASEQRLRVLVFTNRRDVCLYVADLLEANGIRAMALSGALSQKQRFDALNAFKQTPPPVIVATDVASRGLHIDDVTHVINWDVPENPKDYVHRIGRTARAGAEGEALILASEETVEYLPRVEEVIGRKIDVVWAEEHEFVEYQRPPRRPREHKGHGGQRSDRRDGQRHGGNRNRNSRSR